MPVLVSVVFMPPRMWPVIGEVMWPDCLCKSFCMARTKIPADYHKVG